MNIAIIVVFTMSESWISRNFNSSYLIFNELIFYNIHISQVNKISLWHLLNMWPLAGIRYGGTYCVVCSWLYQLLGENNVLNVTTSLSTNQILSTMGHSHTKTNHNVGFFHITSSYYIVPICDIAKYIAVKEVDITTKLLTNNTI